MFFSFLCLLPTQAIDIISRRTSTYESNAHEHRNKQRESDCHEIDIYYFRFFCCASIDAQRNFARVCHTVQHTHTQHGVNMNVMDELDRRPSNPLIYLLAICGVDAKEIPTQSCFHTKYFKLNLIISHIPYGWRCSNNWSSNVVVIKHFSIPHSTHSIFHSPLHFICFKFGSISIFISPSNLLWRSN